MSVGVLIPRRSSVICVENGDGVVGGLQIGVGVLLRRDIGGQVAPL
jgi:hypothetical protein